ncbi:hypothetical protein BKE17_11725 [Enhydrobacter sp. H5]|jgi:hypothetical protein|nr:hypothetical protein BKE17_11725 [Enhydrobacter sp. H5]
MEIQSELKNILENHNGGAFLFIGSGFSRRYLGLEDWASLLSKFTEDVKPFEYYMTSAGGDLAKTASLLAEDFHDKWWDLEKYSEHREIFRSQLKDKSSALRMEICSYLTNVDLNNPPYLTNEKLNNEVKVLSQLNIDGIITTNWDLFLEHIFPNYQKFVGQSELLFSNLLESCEIYKIHGCCSNPHSLVLTNEDYKDFENKNSYLAAKLITIFVEHPIIFIGYSINDENIRSILTSIVKCLDTNNLNKLRKNLIFVQRLKNNEVEQITDSSITFTSEIDNASLPITLIKTDDFEKIYSAILSANKARFPVRLIRHLKEKIYELDFTDSPKEKISVIDAEKIENYEDVDFVIGIGIKDKLGVSEVGYSSIEAIDIIEDIFKEEASRYEPRKLIENVVLQKLKSGTKYLPIFKYLRDLEVTSEKEYEKFKTDTQINLDKIVKLNPNELKDRNKKALFKRLNLNPKSLRRLMNYPNLRDDDLIFYIPFLDWTNPTQKDLEDLKDFLIKIKDDYLPNESNKNSVQKTAYKKLVVLYDKLRFGWN